MNKKDDTDSFWARRHRLLPRTFQFIEGTFSLNVGGVDPTIAGLLGLLWQKRPMILISALLFAVFGFVAARVQTPRYVAQMQVIPNVDDSLNSAVTGLSGLGNLGSLGALAGSSGLLKSERVSPFRQFITIIGSRAVADEMERRGHFLSRTHASLWDAQHHSWKPKPLEWFTPIENLIRAILRMPGRPHPTTEDLAKMIRRHVEVGEDEKSSIFTLTYAASDPQFAKEFLQTLYASTEAVLLQRDRESSLARVKAAEHELEQTTIESSRQSLTNVLTLFHLRAIQAAVGSPYAAQILSPPTVTDVPTRPDLLIYTLGGLLAGSLVSIFLVVGAGMRNARRAVRFEGSEHLAPGLDTKSVSNNDGASQWIKPQR